MLKVIAVVLLLSCWAIAEKRYVCHDQTRLYISTQTNRHIGYLKLNAKVEVLETLPASEPDGHGWARIKTPKGFKTESGDAYINLLALGDRKTKHIREPQTMSTSQAIFVGLALGSSNIGTRQKLLLFGGTGHRSYLGCLNCSEWETDSVLNKFGTYGSDFSSQSIWNHFSEFGSDFSFVGACNSFATDPPVIVDSTGRFFGRLTLNESHWQIGIGTSYLDFLKGVCR